MGTLIGKPRSDQVGELTSTGTGSSRNLLQTRSLLWFVRKKSKEKDSANSEDRSEEEDAIDWFPASHVFPDDAEFSDRALKELRTWHRESDAQNFLPPLKDLHLLLFAHSCLKNLQDAKLCMTKYFTSMVNLPFLFTNWDLEDDAIIQCFNTIIYAIMPVDRSDGYKIMILKFRNTEPEHFLFKDAAKAVLMSIEALVFLQGPPKGLCVVLDVTGMRMGHFARLHINEVKQFLSVVQDVLPIIMHEVGVVNCNYLVPLIMSAIRPFMTTHISNMIKIYTTADMHIFFTNYPKSCLPAEYDGDLESLEIYHNENLNRIKKLVPYWNERQLWIDSRRCHRKSHHRMHGANHGAQSQSGSSRPARATTPS